MEFSDTNTWYYTFFYSPDGMLAREKRKKNGTLNYEYKYIRDGFKTLQVRKPVTVDQAMVWDPFAPGGIGGALELTKGGSQYYYLYDGKGNVQSILDGSQAVVQSYAYDPFGVLVNSSGTLDQRYAFSTKPYYAGLGLNYYGYRFYSPQLGRWINRDPLGEAGGLNLYGFVGNGPMNGVDAWGLEVGDWWDLPANYNRGNEIATEELDNHDGHNDCEDAMRHAEWSRRMTEEMGSEYAWAFGTGHEIMGLLSGQPLNEMDMDFHNNKVGRESAGGTVNPDELITEPVSDSSGSTIPSDAEEFMHTQ